MDCEKLSIFRAITTKKKKLYKGYSQKHNL